MVKFETSSYHGYYVMFFQAENDPTWEITARSTLTSDAMTEWMDGFLGDYPTALAAGADALGR